MVKIKGVIIFLGIFLLVLFAYNYSKKQACANQFEDIDCDGIFDDVDNCKYVYNPTQADSDNNGIGNNCDSGIRTCPYPSTITCSTCSEYKTIYDKWITTECSNYLYTQCKNVLIGKGDYIFKDNGGCCVTLGDVDCNGCVSDSEFPSSVTKWKSLQISDANFPPIVSKWKIQEGC